MQETIKISKEILNPQEQMLEVYRHKKSLMIGIPKENHKEESRIALSPTAVELLSKAGHRVIMESDAGICANFSNFEYSEAGAKITHDRKRVFESELIVKVSPYSLSDIALLSDKQTIISALNIASLNYESISNLIKKRINAIAFEYIKNKDGRYPIVHYISELAGKLSINTASEYLSKFKQGKGVLLGGVTGIPPSEVVIIGAGTSAVNAANAALGLGAVVKIFDKSLDKLSDIRQRIGTNIHTSLIQTRALENALSTAEVVVGALSMDEYYPNYIVSEQMVRKMKKGAIIIDLNVDNGSCFETSKLMPIYNPVYEKYGVLHYCAYNITSKVARTASIVLSNVLLDYLLAIGEQGGVSKLLKKDVGLRNGVYVFNGILTNSRIGRKFSLNSKDINLLMAAW